MTEQSANTNVTSDDKLWALLSYIFAPLIPIIMLLMEDKKNRPFLKFHAVQALVLGIIEFILYAVLGWIFIGFCLGIAIFGYMIYLGVKAYGGESINVPVITDMIKKNGWA